MSVRSLKNTSVKNAQKTSSGVTSSTTAPANPSPGDLWFNSELGKTFIWYVDVDGSQWIEVGSGSVAPPAGNLIYNGAMQVAQRGTSATGITSTGYYTADRFNLGAFSAGTWTQTIENDGPTGSGFRNSLKMLCTTAASSLDSGAILILRQYLEGQDVQSIRKGTVSAESLTLSFWVKSNVTGTYIVNLSDLDNSRTISASYSVSTSGSWEKKTIVLPPDTTGVLDNNNEVSLRLSWYLGAGSNQTSGTLQTAWGATVTANIAPGQTNLAGSTNNYWQITGIKLEIGDTETPFEFKPYGQELQECQRYYYRIYPGNANAFGSGYNTTTTNGRVITPFPVNMRGIPSALEQSGTASHYRVAHANTTTTCSAVPTYDGATSNSLGVSNFPVASGLTAGQGSSGEANNNSAYLGWSAEL
jgi:hypothetical protein